MVLLLLLLFGVRCARQGESENTLSVQRPQPHTTNPWKEEEKEDKIVGDTKERADHANRNALTLGADAQNYLRHLSEQLLP